MADASIRAPLRPTTSPPAAPIRVFGPLALTPGMQRSVNDRDASQPGFRFTRARSASIIDGPVFGPIPGAVVAFANRALPPDRLGASFEIHAFGRVARNAVKD